MPELHLDLTLQRVDRRVTITAPSGRVGISGPSGAGKSTLLRALAGLEPCTGELRVGDTWLQRAGDLVPPWQRGVGWVPQTALLFPHVDVAANLGWAGAQPADVAAMADDLGLTALLSRRSRHLSGGERQRVALGRALLAKPTLLLLDEPFTALDDTLRERVVALLEAWLAARDVALVLVSHRVDDVLALTDERWVAANEGWELG